jgi:hypothetical protein
LFAIHQYNAHTIAVLKKRIPHLQSTALVEKRFRLPGNRGKPSNQELTHVHAVGGPRQNQAHLIGAEVTRFDAIIKTVCRFNMTTFQISSTNDALSDHI